jgi:hypothetical protein
MHPMQSITFIQQFLRVTLPMLFPLLLFLECEGQTRIIQPTHSIKKHFMHTTTQFRTSLYIKRTLEFPLRFQYSRRSILEFRHAFGCSTQYIDLNTRAWSISDEIFNMRLVYLRISLILTRVFFIHNNRFAVNS